MIQANKPVSTADIKQKIQERFKEISDQYDFSGFTLQGFTAWVEGERGKTIQMVPWSMPATIFGAWMESDDMDYIFYHADAIPLHKAHIQLHELAHILCGHKTLPITTELLFNALMGNISTTKLLLRSTKSDQAEQEAELLTSLIQEQLYRYVRFDELTKAVTADEEQRKLFVALGLLD